jgi:gamma-glutamyltranspeptidase/glutathione hydrolase
LEPDVDQTILKELQKDFPNQQLWDSKNLFFGGAHTVKVDYQGAIYGAGDTRRGGVAITS